MNFRFDDNSNFRITSGGAVQTSADRKPILFKITGGSNPYGATEQTMVGSTLADVPTGMGLSFSSSDNLLYELTGDTGVSTNTYVIGFPNPWGQGYIFVSKASVSSGIRTQNEDGTDVEDPTDTIIADEDTGITFDVTGLAAGENKLVMLAASASQMGAVTVTTQTFAGDKTLTGNTLFDGGTVDLFSSGGLTTHFRVRNSTDNVFLVDSSGKNISIFTNTNPGTLFNVYAPTRIWNQLLHLRDTDFSILNSTTEQFGVTDTGVISTNQISGTTTLGSQIGRMAIKDLSSGITRYIPVYTG